VRGLIALKHAVLELVTETEHAPQLTKEQFSPQFLALENLNKSSHAQNGIVQIALETVPLEH